MSAPNSSNEIDLHALISKNIEMHSSPPEKPRIYPKPETTELNAYIDHTLLDAEANIEAIRQLCGEAQNYSFPAVCVHLEWVKLCAKFLDNRLGKWRPVTIACVIDFPDGTGGTKTKAYEAYWAVKDGARELDVVIDYPAIQAGNPDIAFAGIKAVRQEADKCMEELGEKGRVLVKVIIETCKLGREEIISACTIAKAAGADFVKTSTGFKGRGATVENVRLMKAVVGEDVGVKASGGMRNIEMCLKMIEAGASRIGSSRGTRIMSEVREIGDDVKTQPEIEVKEEEGVKVKSEPVDGGEHVKAETELEVKEEKIEY